VHPNDKADLEASFGELTARAEELVVEHTGLRSSAGAASALVLERAEWADANVSSFEHLLAPVTGKLVDRMGGRRGPMRLTRSVTGVEVGALLGWMSSRVLGQYDLLLADADRGGAVYYVGPNVLSLERRFGFEPADFRLWLAVHELTHRAQFTGVSWMRDHYRSLVAELTDSFDPDPERLVAALKDAVATARRGTSRLADGGLAAVLATPRQREVMASIGGLMSLLEGHGDTTMARAGAAAIPGAPRFARVLAQRRANRPTPARLLQRLLGLEAKLAQYAQGERFIAEIEAANGPRAVDACWSGPHALPSLEEIREPRRWLERVGTAAPA
jgi:coenzyme F420 biosynthesis associated uncharacterized protein